MLNFIFIDLLTHRTKLIKASIVIAFFCGMLLSPHLWINSGRLFSMMSPIEGMPILAAPFDKILLFIFVGSSLAWIVIEKKGIGFISLGSLLLLVVQDQMRWQPWVYLYLLMLVPFLYYAEKKENEEALVLCLQFILVGVYVWSGIQKINLHFVDGVLAQFIKLSGIHLSFEGWKKIFYLTPFVIPCVEIVLGLALLVPKVRKIAVCVAIVVHLLILLYLSPMGIDHNSVVYPWNIAMVFFVVFLFWNNNNEMLSSLNNVRRYTLMVFVLALAWIAPALNLFGYWDHYLSFSLYSYKPSRYYIAIDESEVSKIDKRYLNYTAKIKGMQGGVLIDTDKWAYAELNVPFYPETRVFKKLSRNFCALGIAEDKLIFLELSNATRKPHYKTFTCNAFNVH